LTLLTAFAIAALVSLTLFYGGDSSFLIFVLVSSCFGFKGSNHKADLSFFKFGSTISTL
jgi:hypothetical protein